ncbi:hypothetical protein B9H02_11205 [Prosthecochloris sp. HL-130-GSB]|nr:hypothetical protein B9H02_11205 [Prosthecochloris sp. HL-130-GSB]
MRPVRGYRLFIFMYSKVRRKRFPERHYCPVYLDNLNIRLRNSYRRADFPVRHFLIYNGKTGHSKNAATNPPIISLQRGTDGRRKKG